MPYDIDNPADFTNGLPLLPGSGSYARGLAKALDALNTRPLPYSDSDDAVEQRLRLADILDEYRAQPADVKQTSSTIQSPMGSITPWGGGLLRSCGGTLAGQTSPTLTGPPWSTDSWWDSSQSPSHQRVASSTTVQTSAPKMPSSVSANPMGVAGDDGVSQGPYAGLTVGSSQETNPVAEQTLMILADALANAKGAAGPKIPLDDFGNPTLSGQALTQALHGFMPSDQRIVANSPSGILMQNNAPYFRTATADDGMGVYEPRPLSPPGAKPPETLGAGDSPSTPNSIMPDSGNTGGKALAWGAKVSPGFQNKVAKIAGDLRTDPDYLMAVMAFETGGTFSPSIKNAKGSGATGLIQFMQTGAKPLGTTTDALAKMTAEEQLDYVARYLKPHAGKLNNLSDVYMAVLYPKAIGKPDDFVLFDKTKNPISYGQNPLDLNGDGQITKAEATSKVNAMLAQGRKKENAR